MSPICMLDRLLCCEWWGKTGNTRWASWKLDSGYDFCSFYERVVVWLHLYPFGTSIVVCLNYQVFVNQHYNGHMLNFSSITYKKFPISTGGWRSLFLSIPWKDRRKLIEHFFNTFDPRKKHRKSFIFCEQYINLIQVWMSTQQSYRNGTPVCKCMMF